MFHTIIIVGNLGKDPEMKYTPSGQPVTNFSVASNRSYNEPAASRSRKPSGSASPPGESWRKPAISTCSQAAKFWSKAA